MSTPHPKAFISHSTKDRVFVERLAADLRVNGVDAWYSGWEIKAGDSIRARLDQGLAECDIFIIVLSTASIDRPWVKTELDAATVRKLDGKVQKIIPIKIDDCGELPPILGSLMWVDFSMKPYDVAFQTVLHSVFRVETKPPLGEVPDLPPLVASRTTKISSTAAIFWVAMAVAVVLIATKLTINIGLPPLVGQFVGGFVVGGIVWLFFGRVEATLTDQTKLEIAVWLVGVKVGQKVEPWPQTFAKVFDRVFGEKHISWNCVRRSTLNFTFWAAVLFVWLRALTSPQASAQSAFQAFALAWCIDLFPAYLVVLQTLFFMQLLGKALADRADTVTFYVATLFANLIVADCISVGPPLALAAVLPDGPIRRLLDSPLTISVVFASFSPLVGLWLYAGAGLILKTARRFDMGFRWFNRHFDVEKKPLQSIGLVAGALVAVVYWAAVIVSRVVG
jgi:hypothetical protein